MQPSTESTTLYDEELLEILQFLTDQENSINQNNNTNNLPSLISPETLYEIFFAPTSQPTIGAPDTYRYDDGKTYDFSDWTKEIQDNYDYEVDYEKDMDTDLG